MNNFFSFKRFALLLKKTIAERPIQTAGMIGLLLVLSLILYAAAKALAGFGAAQNLTFVWGLVGGNIFLSSFVFGYFGSNASGSSYLTLPASFFEKWLCGIVITGIIYPLLFLPFFYLVDASFVSAYHNSLDSSSLFYKQDYDAVYTFNLNGIIAWKVYQMFLLGTGGMLTGALFFNKAALIKTAIAGCLVFMIMIGVNWLFAEMFFGDINDAGLFDHVTLAVGKSEGIILLPSGIETFFHNAIFFVIPALLWFIPLIRLREKEF